MQSKIKQLKTSSAMFTNDSDMFNNPMGKIFVKEYPAGTASVRDVDNYIKKFEENKGIKVDMVVVDYLTIMSPENKGQNLYEEG